VVDARSRRTAGCAGTVGRVNMNSPTMSRFARLLGSIAQLGTLGRWRRTTFSLAEVLDLLVFDLAIDQAATSAPCGWRWWLHAPSNTMLDTLAERDIHRTGEADTLLDAKACALDAAARLLRFMQPSAFHRDTFEIARHALALAQVLLDAEMEGRRTPSSVDASEGTGT